MTTKDKGPDEEASEPVKQKRERKQKAKKEEKIVELKVDNVKFMNTVRTFPHEAELTNRLVAICYGYEEIGTMAAIGALTAAAMIMWSDHFLEVEEE